MKFYDPKTKLKFVFIEKNVFTVCKKYHFPIVVLHQCRIKDKLCFLRGALEWSQLTHNVVSTFI